MSFRANECESRNLLKLQALSCVGSLTNVVDSSTSLRCGRNDNGETFLRIRLLFLECFTLPRGPHQARPGEPASPEGSFCSVLLGGIIQPHGLYPSRPRNGTQAVPYGFAGRPIFQPAWFKNLRSLPSADKTGPRTKTQKLSIVHCQFGKNCQLSTVNCTTPAASCKPPPARPGWSRGSWGRGSGRRLRF